MNLTRKTIIIFVILLHTYCSATILDKYISMPDDSYQYTKYKEIHRDGITAYAIKLTSQTWGENYGISPSKWQHWLIIYKPDNIIHPSTSLLWVNGGSNIEKSKPPFNTSMAQIALETNSITASISNVPNQPLIFDNDGKERYEDDIIALSLRKAKETGQYQRITLLPMAKSVVRAMDTIEDFIAKQTNNKLEIRDFVITGASKRGWTTWLSAIADSRVVAIAPQVIDMLNMGQQMDHHFKVYNNSYSDAVKDYVDNNILQSLNSHESEELKNVIDPYQYLNRLTLPKFLINSAQDQFFVSDSSQFYFSKLKGKSILRYIANTDHSLKNSDYINSLTAFYYCILTGTPIPSLKTEMITDNTYKITPVGLLPQAGLLWQAENKTSRDFRISAIGARWQSTEIKNNSNDNSYIIKIMPPSKGWQASFAEFNFLIAEKYELKLTSEVLIQSASNN